MSSSLRIIMQLFSCLLLFVVPQKTTLMRIHINRLTVFGSVIKLWFLYQSGLVQVIEAWVA